MKNVMNSIWNWIKLSTFIFALSTFVSCEQIEDFSQETTALQFVVSDFPAFGEGTQTRAIGTQDEGKTAWVDGDKILVHLYSQEYENQAVTLTFRNGDWISDGGTLSYLKDENPTITAVYAPDCEIKSDNTIGLIDDRQYGEAEYILAKTTINGNTLDIRFESGRTYSRLRIATMPGATLTITTGGFTPAGATEVATDAYTLTTDENGNAYLYGTFAAGATVSVKQGDDDLADHTFTDATVVGVSYALNCSYPYLTFTADAEQTMKIITTGGYTLHESMEYSVNKGEWEKLTAGTDIHFGGDKGTLRLRGKSSGGTSDGYDVLFKVSFGISDVKVACSGDIRTLVDYENCATVSTANARFIALFEDCKNLTTAPELPATMLANECYSLMFHGCTSLTKAPELPATELADYCYKGMFFGCTSLTITPELPATMLADDCYGTMFSGCTNLTAASELPATELANLCYRRMFFGCTNLTIAPELPATTLTECCYESMFEDCTSLNSITMLATDISASYCLTGWVKNVASIGTFYKNSEATWNVTGSSGIPEGWTVVER